MARPPKTDTPSTRKPPKTGAERRQRVKKPTSRDAQGYLQVPPAARREVYEKFRQHTDLAIERLVGILKDETADYTHVIAAAKEIISRGWGSVPQHHVIEALMKHEHMVNDGALKLMSTDQLVEAERLMSQLLQLSGPRDITPSVLEAAAEPAQEAVSGFGGTGNADGD